MHLRSRVKRSRFSRWLRRPYICFAFLCFFSWKSATEVKKPSKQHGIGAVEQGEPSSKKCIVVINGYKRHILLTALAIHYSQMPRVDKVIVNWGNMKSQPRLLQRRVLRLNLNNKIRIIKRRQDSLNDRFKPIEEKTTNCTVIADDDIFIKQTDFNNAIDVWSRDETRLIGAFPRSHVQTGPGELVQYIGSPKDRYSMVLTKFMVMHSSYLEYYTYAMPEQVRTYVQAKHNCEDIAMNLMISRITGMTSTYVKMYPKYDFGEFGLYSRGNHMDGRSQCLMEIPFFMSVDIPKHTELAYGPGGVEESFKSDRYIKPIGLRKYVLTCKIWLALHVHSDASGVAHRISDILWP